MMIGAILKIKEFNEITHIYKLDDHDTKFNENLINDLVNLLSKKILIMVVNELIILVVNIILLKDQLADT